MAYGYGRTTAEYDVMTYEWLVGRGLDIWGGCFVYRKKRASGTELSTHAYGAADDWNPAENRQGTHGNMPQWWVNIWKSENWTWGGDWDNPDPMHVQACSGY